MDEGDTMLHRLYEIAVEIGNQRNANAQSSDQGIRTLLAVWWQECQHHIEMVTTNPSESTLKDAQVFVDNSSPKKSPS